MRRLLRTMRKHPFAGAAFVLALTVTLVFAVRTAMFAVYWSDPANRDLAPEGWMTPGHVAQSWQVPREVMRAAIGPAADGGRQTLDEIAAAQGVTTEDLIARIEAAIAAHRQDAPQ